MSDDKTAPPTPDEKLLSACRKTQELSTDVPKWLAFKKSIIDEGIEKKLPKAIPNPSPDQVKAYARQVSDKMDAHLSRNVAECDAVGLNAGVYVKNPTLGKDGNSR